ncbi:galactokinase [Flavobacterium lacus]|uniref:Galactokinase n=1 Tax=Flavobacterium lacus TaxID=1353778 RepID=A0A328WRY2_9FLAO|nr:galactokinase [Flavobacterium lacus]RAR47896.1 galactokinase [Flavobacterium lacus]
MKKKLISATTEHFKTIFQHEPQAVFLSPGRINIIGEHVDYNDGFVLPAAINKYICFAISKSENEDCTLVAKDINESYQFNWKEEVKPVDKMWVNYILGVLQQLKERNFELKGINIVFSSTIPIGAGLSSSAALECGFGYAMNKLFNLGLSREEIARMGQKSEHTFVGVKCGIMDQFASVFGKKNKVIKLDCTSLEHEYHSADFKKYALLLIDSNVKHTHLTSGYNTRREEVEKGLAIINNRFPLVKTFRDCTERQLIELKEELGETIAKRCHFVVNEIRRVNEAVYALDRNNFEELGKLMFETHEGLSKEYEVSCEEVDFLVDFVKNEKQVIGSRMMGGGFGGCSINLVEKGSEDALFEKIAAAYAQKFGIQLNLYKVKIAKGTSKVKTKIIK